jgi:hypothetical protein
VLGLFPGAGVGGGAQPNISVLGGEASGSVRSKSVLYVNNVWVVSTSSRGRLLRALVRGVEHTVAAAEDDHLELHGTVLARDGAVVFVDSTFGPAVRDAEAKLRRSSWKVWDVPAALLDLRARRLVSPPAVESVDRRALAAVTADDRVRPTELADLGAVAPAAITWLVPDHLRESPANHLLGLLRPHAGHCVGATRRLTALAEFVAGGVKGYAIPGSGKQVLAEIDHLVG